MSLETELIFWDIMFRLHFELECGACERACTMNRHRKTRRTERCRKMYTLIKVVWTPAALGPGCDPRPGSHCWAYSVIPHSQTGQPNNLRTENAKNAV